MIVARTTSARVGHTILNHSARTPRINSIIFFIRRTNTLSSFYRNTRPEFFGRGRRNRTLIRGFGDRCSTIEPCPFVPRNAPLWFESIPIFRDRLAIKSRKIKRNYYNFFLEFMQAENKDNYKPFAWAKSYMLACRSDTHTRGLLTVSQV